MSYFQDDIFKMIFKNVHLVTSDQNSFDHIIAVFPTWLVLETEHLFLSSATLFLPLFHTGHICREGNKCFLNRFSNQSCYSLHPLQSYTEFLDCSFDPLRTCFISLGEWSCLHRLAVCFRILNSFIPNLSGRFLFSLHEPLRSFRNSCIYIVIKLHVVGLNLQVTWLLKDNVLVLCRRKQTKHLN